MRPEESFKVGVLLFIFLSANSFSESSYIEVPVSTTNQLISVNSSLDFTRILPNYEHKGAVFISWNVPPEAIRSVSANSVPIYVSVTTDSKNPIFFKQNGINSKEAQLTLNCIVENGGCSYGSNLTESLDVIVLASDLSATNFSVLINASLKPFPAIRQTGSANSVGNLSQDPESFLFSMLGINSSALNLSNLANISNSSLENLGINKSFAENALFSNVSENSTSTSNSLLGNTLDFRLDLDLFWQNIIPLFSLIVIVALLAITYFSRNNKPQGVA